MSGGPSKNILLPARKCGRGSYPISGNTAPTEIPLARPGCVDREEMFLTVHCSDIEKAPRNDPEHDGAHAHGPETEPEGAEEYVMV